MFHVPTSESSGVNLLVLWDNPELWWHGGSFFHMPNRCQVLFSSNIRHVGPPRNGNGRSGRFEVVTMEDFFLNLLFWPSNSRRLEWGRYQEVQFEYNIFPQFKVVNIIYYNIMYIYKIYLNVFVTWSELWIMSTFCLQSCNPPRMPKTEDPMKHGMSQKTLRNAKADLHWQMFAWGLLQAKQMGSVKWWNREGWWH